MFFLGFQLIHDSISYTFSGLRRLVVDLAEQLLVLHQVELVAGVHLPVADDAGEAVHVVDVVLRATDHVRRGDPARAGRALGAVQPENIFVFFLADKSSIHPNS